MNYNAGGLGIAIELVTLNLNGGADVLGIESISVQTTVNAGAGNDMITVSNTDNTVAAIVDTLTLNGEADTDTLVIDDSGAGGNTGTLTTTQVSGARHGRPDRLLHLRGSRGLPRRHRVERQHFHH